MEQINKFERDSNGLLKSVEYKFKDDGSVNWRAMLKPEHLVVQKEKREKVEQLYGKKIEELDITTIDDKYLLILLSGIKHLAQLRSFKHVQQHVDFVNHEKAVVTCTIQFAGNYETNNQDVVFSDVASASISNTSGFGQHFLESIAANRAFVRAVRNFLGINIVGQDEISPKGADDSAEIPPPQEVSAHSILERKMNEKGFNFETIRETCIKNYTKELNSKPDEWKSIKDIPQLDVFTLLGKLEKVKK